jgi:ABC-type glycerol-3-phosphate transport system permease component
MAAGEIAELRAGAISRRGKPRARRIKIGTLIRHVVLVGFMLVILVPLAWVLLLSIKSIPDAYRPGFWPENFDFTHYAYVVEKIPTLSRNMLNSVLVTLSTVVLTTVCAVLGGYALVHLTLKGRAIVLALLVASLFFPTRVTSLIAIFETQRALGLINTTVGLILPYVTLNLALSVFIMRGIFEQISHELVDAAKIDGAGAWRTLFSVLLPLTRNGIVVVVIVNFVTAWGEYLLGVTLTNDQEVRTLPVVLAGAFGGMGQWAWPRIAAVYVIAVLPGLAAFTLTQRWYMQGLQEGALKY